MSWLLLTHGAGANRDAPLLQTMEAAFRAEGVNVLRLNLAFRQLRPHGPPRRGDAERDRAGLREAIAAARAHGEGPVYLGGHSYGGRQASMLAAEEPGIADGLLLLSYPLHPPNKPAELRTQHLPELPTPAMFVHGGKDPFGSLAEMEAAIALIPARTRIVALEKAGHSLALSAQQAREIAGQALAFWKLS